MVITDLEYLKRDHSSKDLMGGVFTSITSSTYTSYGQAYASATAVASGWQTQTNVSTNTTVTTSSFYSSSSAQATASAYAQTGNTISVYNVNDFSLSLYFQSGHP